MRSLRARGGLPGDRDLDGIHDVFDVDDDGDLILDDLDRSARARTAQAPNDFGLHSVLGLPPEAVLNANATAVSDQQIDATLSTADAAYLIVNGIAPGAELDCGGAVQQPPRQTGLAYCSPGGTGRAFKGDGQCCTPRTAWPRFPDDFDSDGNGLGTPPMTPGPASGAFFLSHGATSAQIGTGDVVMRRTATDAVPATLQFVFATVPALMSYTDTAGNSAQVRYPVAPGDPGSQTNGFPAGAPVGQDVVLMLTFWRPQRRPIAGEPCLLQTPPCNWVDIGGLAYTAIVQHVGEPPGGIDVAKGCPSSSLSSSDLQVTAGPAPNGGAAMVDRAPDRPASPANTFTYTLNLSQCLAALGVSWNPGERLDLTNLGLSATGGGDAAETVIFKRQ